MFSDEPECTIVWATDLPLRERERFLSKKTQKRKNKQGGIDEKEIIIQDTRDNMDQQNTDSDVDRMIDDFPDEVSDQLIEMKVECKKHTLNSKLNSILLSVSVICRKFATFDLLGVTQVKH